MKKAVSLLVLIAGTALIFLVKPTLKSKKFLVHFALARNAYLRLDMRKAALHIDSLGMLEPHILTSPFYLYASMMVFRDVSIYTIKNKEIVPALIKYPFDIPPMFIYSFGGIALLKIGDIRGEDYIKKAIREGFSSGYMANQYGIYLAHRQERAPALMYFNKSLKMGFMPWKNYRSIGDIYFYTEEYDSAIVYYTLSRKWLPDNVDVIKKLLKCYYITHKIEKAEPLVMAVIKAKPFDPELIYLVGVYFENTGFVDKAMYYYTIAVNAAYKSPKPYKFYDAMIALSEMYEIKGDFTTALRIAREVLKDNPENVRMLSLVQRIEKRNSKIK